MKVVALVSGGKDSVFNMLKCVENGHTIVALANAKPDKEGETDSFMYQTVGQSMVRYIAECMELPLYQVEIKGKPINQELEYTETVNDEAESVYELLKNVLKEHPDIGGVSVGAILSTYQANRVQNICDRLGLQMLAYLWNRDQLELLDEMIDSRMCAVLIKVASIGLGKNDLCKTLSEMRPKLVELNKKYGAHICGEGGEFESFTLDCPLYKKKLIIDDWEVITHSDDAFAPVYYANIKKITVVDKDV